MTTSLSKKSQKSRLKGIRKKMKKYGLLIKDLYQLVDLHATTIKRAMSEEDSYFNDKVMAAAEGLIQQAELNTVTTNL
ncbi:hypothetical protein ACE38W_14855 [Chitinophaga sp. Hz27]|uniref:hypothetical protein n=1 Tax=Chitinophaga sp. Hz27 TaxID=3347169 RepID=UPI0035DD22CB